MVAVRSMPDVAWFGQGHGTLEVRDDSSDEMPSSWGPCLSMEMAWMTGLIGVKFIPMLPVNQQAGLYLLSRCNLVTYQCHHCVAI